MAREFFTVPTIKRENEPCAVNTSIFAGKDGIFFDGHLLKDVTIVPTGQETMEIRIDTRGNTDLWLDGDEQLSVARLAKIQAERKELNSQQIDELVLKDIFLETGNPALKGSIMELRKTKTGSGWEKVCDIEIRNVGA